MKIGDVMAVKFDSTYTWDWVCVEYKGYQVVVLQSPGGKREVHTLPLIRKWVKEGRVEIRSGVGQ